MMGEEKKGTSDKEGKSKSMKGAGRRHKDGHVEGRTNRIWKDIFTAIYD